MFGVPDEIPDVTRSPEWSGGKDLYMGSLVLVTGKVSCIIGIVPGVPKGVRGSTEGSTCLMFDDNLYYELCVFDDRSLFGVPDEITDITKSLEMVKT